MSIEISPKSFFEQPSVADMRLIACPGAEELTGLIDKHLVRWAKAAGIEKDTFIISCDCPRFQSGDAKGLVKESVRGDDIFIVVDPGNYSVTYKLFNYENHMSPDDHFANLKRLIQAVAGKAHRVSVIMPSLYGGRQHRRVVRESLDCAVALQELQTMGVRNIITFDAHDPRVVNAIPRSGFENVKPTYQFIKTLLRTTPDLEIDNDHMMVISPDEGAMHRAIYFANLLGVDVGMFYKRRDYTKVVDGRNPIVAHEFLGDSVEGKDVVIIDDMIASGESMIDVARQLKEQEPVLAPFMERELRRKLKMQLQRLIDKWEPVMGVKSAGFTIKKMKTRWGSCNVKSHHLNFNLLLAKVPSECAEYVVVHELTHLLEPSHNARFWSLMEYYLPESKKLRKQLAGFSAQDMI